MSIAQSQVYDRAYLERPLPVFGEDLLRRFDAFILDDSLYGEYAVRQRLIKRCVPKRLYSVALEALSKGGTALSTDNAAVVVEVIEIPQHLSILSHPGANFDKLSGYVSASPVFNHAEERAQWQAFVQIQLILN